MNNEVLNFETEFQKYKKKFWKRLIMILGFVMIAGFIWYLFIQNQELKNENSNLQDKLLFTSNQSVILGITSFQEGFENATQSFLNAGSSCRAFSVTFQGRSIDFFAVQCLSKSQLECISK